MMGLRFSLFSRVGRLSHAYQISHDCRHVLAQWGSLMPWFYEFVLFLTWVSCKEKRTQCPSSRKQSYSLFHTPQGSDASHSLLSWLSSRLLLLCPSWLMMTPSRSLPRVQWVLWRDREPSHMLLRQMYTKKKQREHLVCSESEGT